MEKERKKGSILANHMDFSHQDILEDISRATFVKGDSFVLGFIDSLNSHSTNPLYNDKEASLRLATCLGPLQKSLKQFQLGIEAFYFSENTDLIFLDLVRRAFSNQLDARFFLKF